MIALIWSWLQPFAAVIIPAIVLASPWIVAAIPVAGPVAASVLLWRPPIPLHVLIAAGVWAWLDRDGAIMQAVKSATKDLVAGEELAAGQQREAGQQMIIRTLERQNEAYLNSLTALSVKLADMQASDTKQLQDDLDANKSDGNGRDSISDLLFDRLRNK